MQKDIAHAILATYAKESYISKTRIAKYYRAFIERGENPISSAILSLGAVRDNPSGLEVRSFGIDELIEQKKILKKELD